MKKKVKQWCPALFAPHIPQNQVEYARTRMDHMHMIDDFLIYLDLLCYPLKQAWTANGGIYLIIQVIQDKIHKYCRKHEASIPVRIARA
eukprot:CAMPEP_0178508008 /NCGR_PEP_ID=MMETSP0696-20121128/20521_1 /TAXON_ID=265572 /ORGANISM="Extubocellulus spinifer, Strain CCMP396" /LENGTH=88 /DNA_ID=CAMNT_0020137529 /DNA_START=10 /DNA_END=273 /DNA_ORIENTATION=-